MPATVLPSVLSRTMRPSVVGRPAGIRARTGSTVRPGAVGNSSPVHFPPELLLMNSQACLIVDWADWTSDQRWTLARVAALIRRLFGVTYTLREVSYLLHRIGWIPQVPARRAIERDEDAITAWKATTWAKVRG